MKYYIQDTRSYCGDSVMWWRHEGAGYTFRLDEACEYDEEEARAIERGRDTDIAIPVEVARAAASRHSWRLAESTGRRENRGVRRDMKSEPLNDEEIARLKSTAKWCVRWVGKIAVTPYMTERIADMAALALRLLPNKDQTAGDLPWCESCRSYRA